jgi:tape measure domain-containing protein
MAQLELSVVLNLANFRTQLGKLAQASAAYYYPINLTIDKQAFRKQLAALGNIKPVIKINDSQLDAARARIGTLNKSLATLRRATSTPIEIKLKYVEIGKPPSGAGSQIGRAVSGGVRGGQSVESFNYKQLQATRQMMQAAKMPVGSLGGGRSVEAYLNSIVEGFKNASEESINGLASGLKSGNSEIATAAKKVGEAGVRAIKDSLGIASPSRVFKQIGEFSVDGLELGFLNGLKDFKSKSIAEIKKIVALMRFELAKVSNVSGIGGPSMGSLRRQLVGQRAYTSPIGPQPLGSKTPWAAGSAGQFGSSGFEPRMVSRPYGQPLSAQPNSFLGFSRSAAQVQPSGNTPGSFLGFSQRATQVTQASGGAGNVPPTPPLPPRRGGGGGSFGGMQFNVPQLPGAGLVREIGEEFGFAAKQVLLYGTAYKALGLLQTFPAQVGEAVGALQTFRNTISEISPSAKEAAESSQFILDIVEKYNTPLQSARDGFVKLYASMQPAGFSGDEIRDLFLGISQTAATFGMSADKVDRVNYAFAQMASKGQVMSEELKGQLGDVLPGAMAIFAEAAGFKGPEAITKFSKALEDGAYKGGAMKTLLTNVGSIMRKEFGPGAEGAARTFQGVMNRMQNSAKLLYEAFEPVAVGFLNSVVMPLTSGLKTVTDGFNAFFTGVNTKTTGGFAFAQELEKLRPTLEGIRANVTALLPTLQSFVNTLLNVSKVFLQIVGNPFVGYLARVYLNVLALTTAINILNLRALIPMIANFARSLYALVAFAVQCVSTGSVVQRLGMAVQVTGLMLRTFFATNGIGLVLVGIGLLTERFMSMNQALADTKAKALGASDAIRAMSQTEARQASQQYDRQAQSLKGLSKEIEDGKMKGKAWIEVTKEQAEALKSAGITVSDVRGSLQVQPMRIGGAYQKLEGLAAEAKFRVRGLDYQDKQIEQQADIAPVTPSADEDKKKTNLESYYSLQDQLAKAQTQGEIDRIQDAFEHRFNLINAAYDLEDARANSFQKATIAFQKELVAIEQKRQQSAIRAQAEVLKAQGSVAGGAPSAPILPSSGGGGGAFDTGMRTGPSSAIGGSADYHQDIMFGSTVSMKERVQLMDQLAQGYEKMGRAIEFSNAGVAGERYRSSMSYEAKSSLISRAQAAHANRPGGSGRAAMDFYAPLASGNRFGTSVEGQAMLAPSVEGASYSYGGGGRAGRTMTASRGGAMVYEQLHGSMATPLQAKAPAPVKASEKRQEVAAVTAAIAVRRENTLALNAEEMAVQETAIAYEKYVASIAPIAEQELQNSLLEKRIQLMNSGVTGDFLETQVKIFEAEEKTRIAGEMLDKTNAAQVEGYQRLQQALPGYIASLRDAAVAQQDLNFATAQSDLAKRKAMAGALTPDAELRVELAQKYPGNLARQEEEFSQTKLVQGMEKAKQDLQSIASSISNAFGEAFKGIVTGSMTAQEALSGFFQSVADSFADMVANMIAEYLKMALIKGIMSIIGNVPGGFGGAFGASGPSFNAGAFSGPALSPGAAFGGAGVESFSGAFSGGEAAFNPAAFSIPKFANGGVVTGPTLGMVGEGRYNEAVIPLPDGKSVPVQLSGGDGGNQINSNITVNVSNGQAQSNATGSNSSELGRKIEGAVKQVIVGELRPGGLLASR